MTMLLIGACFVVFFYELSIEGNSGEGALNQFLFRYGLVPDKFLPALRSGDVSSPAFLAVFSSMFLHSGWLHILGNMLYLWIFGNNVEDRIGSLPFLVFYLAGGLIAGLTQAWIDPTSTVPLVGASGAIAAALGAYLVLYPGARVLSLLFLGIIIQLIEIPAIIVLGFWFVLQLIDAQAALGQIGQAAGGVAFFAHVGGFVFGMAVGAILRASGGARRASSGWRY